MHSIGACHGLARPPCRLDNSGNAAFFHSSRLPGLRSAARARDCTSPSSITAAVGAGPVVLTDLHCHMLHGIDDGAKTLEQSLAMARIAVADGIGTTVVTPHHLNGVYRNPARQVRDRVDRLREALAHSRIELDLVAGSELHLTPELPDALVSGTALTLADRGRAALVELPVHTVPMGSEHVLEQILAQGIVPVIAHPERNSELRQHPQRLAEWIQMGCLGQVTAQSCTGGFGEAVKKSARAMVRQGLIHVVASDAHRDRRRIPQITPAREPVANWTSPAVAQLLIDVFPAEIGAGRDLERGRLDRAIAEIQPVHWWQKWF
ncbi:MAG: CpsB/CapC family capsule biosynthesis tyrosine phosphatase [Wenzhouxiangellaceae bacterium]|nr:CpsB/CapC family capsule biosynthesis tyrosine phosphatase [Wenzhouxiangellaceae bacterium]